jgi:hypothetical protein
MLGEDNPHNNGATPDDHPGHPDNDGWSSSEGGRNAWRTVRSLGSGDNSRHRHQRRRAVEERAPSAFIAAGADVESSARRDSIIEIKLGPRQSLGAHRLLHHKYERNSSR